MQLVLDQPWPELAGAKLAESNGTGRKSYNNFSGDTGVNFCKNSRYFTICANFLTATEFTSVCACTSDRERSTRTSFTRMNNSIVTGARINSSYTVMIFTTPGLKVVTK